MTTNHEQAQTGDCSASTPTAIHPVIAALEKADAATVVIEGFLGTSTDLGAMVRLYETLDVSAYVELQREAIVHIQANRDGEPGAVRAFVRATSEIISVRRVRARAGDYRQVPQPIFPPLRTCADFCEDAFKPRVTRYFVALTRALNEPNPDRQAAQLALATDIKAQAKDALYMCLSQCALKNPGHYFFGIGETYSAILKRNHMEEAE